MQEWRPMGPFVNPLGTMRVVMEVAFGTFDSFDSSNSSNSFDSFDSFDSSNSFDSFDSSNSFDSFDSSNSLLAASRRRASSGTAYTSSCSLAANKDYTPASSPSASSSCALLCFSRPFRSPHLTHCGLANPITTCTPRTVAYPLNPTVCTAPSIDSNSTTPYPRDKWLYSSRNR